MDHYNTEATNTYTCKSTRTSLVQSTNHNNIYYQRTQQNQEYSSSRAELLSQPPHIYQTSSIGPASTKTKEKRKRISLSAMQLNQLELFFRETQYLSREDRFELAQQLKLSENQIKVWFQNRRMKSKKEAMQQRAKKQSQQNLQHLQEEKSHKEMVRRLMKYSYAN